MQMPELGRAYSQEFRAESLFISRVASFDFHASSRDSLRTVFLQCESEQLEAFSYKPDFPDSVFHASVYDGKPDHFAKLAYDCMKTFDWGLTVNLPELALTQYVTRGTVDHTVLTRRSRTLLSRLSGLTSSEIATLDDEARLELIEKVCAYMHKSTKTGHRKSLGESSLMPVLHDRQILEQGELWPIHELLDVRSKEQSRARTKDGGRYITPPEIATDVVRTALAFSSAGPIDFGDPAVGNGIFLAALMREAPRALRTATGFEADVETAEITKRRWRRGRMQVINANFVELVLSQNGPSLIIEDGSESVAIPSPSILVANPPYVRSQRLDMEVVDRWRQEIRRRLELLPDRRCDLYVYFVLASHFWLKQGAVATWLLPTEFMFTNYGQVLRDYLTKRVQLLRIHTYEGESKFDKARITTCAVTYRLCSPQSDQFAVFSVGDSISTSAREVKIGSLELSSKTKWHRLGFASPAVHRVGGIHVGDLFDVKRGVATGANDYLVLDLERARSLEVPLEWIRPVVPRPRDVEGDMIPPIDPLPFNNDPRSRWMIDCDASMQAIERKSPKFASYLLAIESVIGDRALVKRRSLFYKQEGCKPAPLLFKYMRPGVSVGPRFLLNRSNGVALNSYICLYPKGWIADHLASSDSAFELLVEGLNSTSADEYAATGRIYEGGLSKLEPMELRRLPVPADVRGYLTRLGMPRPVPEVEDRDFHRASAFGLWAR